MKSIRLRIGQALFYGIFLLALIGVGVDIHDSRIAHAQGLATNSFAVSPSVTLTQCEANAIANYTNYCSLGAGELYTCLSTTTTCGTSQTGWICIAGCATTAPTGAVLVINGVSPGSTGTITLTCVGSNPAASVTNTPTTSGSTITLVGNVAASSVPVTCTAKGS